MGGGEGEGEAGGFGIAALMRSDKVEDFSWLVTTKKATDVNGLWYTVLF